MHKHLLTYNALYFSIEFLHYFCTFCIQAAGCRTLYVMHWSSGRQGHNNYRRDLVIWLVHLIYSAVGFALCYNYVILNYCIRFAVLPCVRLCLNSCFILHGSVQYVWIIIRALLCPILCRLRTKLCPIFRCSHARLCPIFFAPCPFPNLAGTLYLLSKWIFFIIL